MSNRTCSCVSPWTTRRPPKQAAFPSQLPASSPALPFPQVLLPLGRLILGLFPHQEAQFWIIRLPASDPPPGPAIFPGILLLTTSWRQCRIRCCLACSSCSRSCCRPTASSSSWLWAHRALSSAHRPYPRSPSTNACLENNGEKVTKTHSRGGDAQGATNARRAGRQGQKPQRQKKSNILRPQGVRKPSGLCPGSSLTSHWLPGRTSPSPPTGSGGAGSGCDAPSGGGPAG